MGKSNPEAHQQYEQKVAGNFIEFRGKRFLNSEWGLLLYK